MLFKIALYIVTITFVVYLFPKGGQFKFEFQKGKSWQYETYYAPFDFAIQKTADEIDDEIEHIKSTSNKYYVNSEEVVFQVTKSSFEQLQELISENDFTKSEENKLKRITHEIIDKTYEVGFIDLILEDQSSMFFSIRKGNEVQDIQRYKLIDVQGLNKLIDEIVKREHLKPNLVTAFTTIQTNLKPNVFYDEEFSKKVIQENIGRISFTTGFTAKNELIIAKNDIVEGEKWSKLNSIRNEFESQLWSSSNYNFIIFGYTLLIALSFLMLLLFLRKYRYDIFENNTKVTFIFFNVTLVLLVITLIVKYDAKFIYVVPIVMLPLILKAFFDSRLGLFTHVLTVLLLGFIVPNSFEFVFLQIIAGMVTILTISELYKRANLFISVLQITFVYFISYLSFSIIQEGNLQNLNYEKFVFFGLNGAATLFVLPLIYVYEKLFGLVSDESLKELSNTNSKLLRELAEKAPGTFQHSLQVANLVEACAIEINANVMLARTGALYHDIGKMLNPMYFTENQSTNVNPHNQISPVDSAAIIIAHIINGVKLAKKHHLPDRIIDFIRTHHGTTLVYYFYKKEEELQGENVEVSSFLYPGPIPFSKETAILMMCDSVEAASKSLKIPTAQQIDTLVEKIITKQMEDGQFMNADITFKELQLVIKVLKKKLKNIYHLRIEYPE